MEMKFRDLQASEIDVRVATVSDKGCSLLLYKDARVDMDILDETVGANELAAVAQPRKCKLYY